MDMTGNITEKFKEALSDPDREKALKIVLDAVAEGAAPEDILFQVIFPVMEIMITSGEQSRAHEGREEGLGEHTRIGLALRAAQQCLEQRVSGRTADLLDSPARFRIEHAARRRAEEELAKREAEYRTLFGKIQAAVVVHGAATQINSSNSLAQDLLGLTEEQLMGKTAVDPAWHFFREDGTVMPQEEYPVNRVHATGEAIRNLMMGVHRPGKGKDVWVLVNANPVFGNEGEITHVIVTFIDVTDRRQVEDALRKSEENYRQLLDTVQEGIWVIDNEAMTTFVNPRMAEILGYLPEEMVGKHLFSFMDEQGKVVAGENIERRKQGIKEQHDFEFIRKNGERISTRLETGPIFDETGAYAGSIAAVADITESRAAEHRLRASERAFRAVVENSPDVIVRYDREGRRIYVNPEFERVNRLSAQEALGKTPVQLSTELAPMAAVFTEKLMTAMASGTVAQVDLTWIAEGKQKCWFVRIVPEFDETGAVISALTIWSDITERKLAEEEIHTLNTALEQRVQDRTGELEEKNRELERMNRLFVGRELRMRELKERINELEKKINAQSTAHD